MGSQIIKQTLIDGNPLMVGDHECVPGKFAVWSSVVDNFILCSATREEVIEFFVERERERIERDIGRKFDKIEDGEPAYYQFTKTFVEAVDYAVKFHGERAFAQEGPEKDQCPECFHVTGEEHEPGCPIIEAVYCPCCGKYPSVEDHVPNCEYDERLQHRAKMDKLDQRQIAFIHLEAVPLDTVEVCKHCDVPLIRISEFETRNYGHQETCPQKRWVE